MGWPLSPLRAGAGAVALVGTAAVGAVTGAGGCTHRMLSGVGVVVIMVARRIVSTIGLSTIFSQQLCGGEWMLSLGDSFVSWYRLLNDVLWLLPDLNLLSC